MRNMRMANIKRKTMNQYDDLLEPWQQQQHQGTTDRKTVRVFVMANPDFYLEGLLAVLSRSTDSEVVACVKPGNDCWNAFVLHPADVVLIHRQALLTHPERMAQFLQYAPDIKILLFGHDMSDEFLLRMLRAGAVGYINEKMNGDHLLKAIQKVMQGEFWVERRLLQRLTLRSVEIEGEINRAIESIRTVLTNREAEIYRCVLGGLSTREIAGEMHLSEQSVKLHLGNLFKKFGVSNKHQLIVQTLQKVCPVPDVLDLFRTVMHRHRLAQADTPDTVDPV
jgi:DNA-binding NarL/FixJ family response regulator